MVPVAVGADDVPAGDRLRFGLVAADDVADTAAEGLDDRVGLGVRIDDEVIDAVCRDCEILAACGCRRLAAEVDDERLHVAGGAEILIPGLVLAELELVVFHQLDTLGHGGLAVGSHFEVAVPADTVLGQGADDAPGTRLRVFRIGQVGVRDGDHGVAAGEVEPEVIDTVCRDCEVLAAADTGEVGVHRDDERFDVAGCAIVVIPLLVLAELELVVLADRDSLGDELVAVGRGEHLEILVPVHLISGQGADDAPVARLGVVGIRAADREGHNEIVDRDAVHGVDETVAAVVAGRILHGGADRQHDGRKDVAVGIAVESEGLADVDHRGREGGAVILGGDDAADGVAVDGNQRQVVDRGHLLVEPHIEDGGCVVHGDFLLTEINVTQQRRGGVVGVEHRQFLLDAGRGSQGKHACGYDG